MKDFQVNTRNISQVFVHLCRPETGLKKQAKWDGSGTRGSSSTLEGGFQSCYCHEVSWSQWTWLSLPRGLCSLTCRKRLFLVLTSHEPRRRASFRAHPVSQYFKTSVMSCLGPWSHHYRGTGCRVEMLGLIFHQQHENSSHLTMPSSQSRQNQSTGCSLVCRWWINWLHGCGIN